MSGASCLTSIMPTATDCAIHKDGTLFIVVMSVQIITMNAEGASDDQLEKSLY